MASTTNTSTTGGIADTISHAVNYVTESVSEMTSAASKEKNKEVAKGHTDASLSERASGAFNAVGDKLEEEGHSSKADAHKEMAKH